MNTLRTALAPGLIAGLLSIFASGILMGGIFHRFQRETPESWKPEGGRSYLLSSLLHVFSAFAIACLFTLIVRFNVALFPQGFFGSFLFGLCLWIAVPLPIILQSAIFLRIHRMVVVGRLLDALATSLLACMITGWWIR